MTSLLSPGNYTLELRTIAEPKIKSPKSALLCHSFGVPGQLSTYPSWLYFSDLNTLNAYLLAAPALLGKTFAVEVKVKTERVGNREFSWNTLHPKWGLGFILPSILDQMEKDAGLKAGDYHA
jgi:hypothetical protein